jgi:hypothetical protein
MFLDVRFHRQKIRVDEAGDGFIPVGLGFQPSASASSRSRAEIEQDRPARLLRLGQSGIDVFAPLNRHELILYLRGHFPFLRNVSPQETENVRRPAEAASARTGPDLRYDGSACR